MIRDPENTTQTNMTEGTTSKLEPKYNLANIAQEIEYVKNKVEHKFSEKIKIINDLIDAETTLIGSIKRKSSSNNDCVSNT